MTQKNIEFACTGNNGRSPFAAAYAQRYLEQTQRDDKYKAISSGTNVDEILAGDMALGLKKRVLKSGFDKGLEGTIYSTQTEVEDAKSVKESVDSLSDEELEKKHSEDSDFKSKFDQYAESSRQYFASEENKHCVETAKAHGIEDYLDGNFKQTKPSEDTVAFLPMGASNLKKAKGLYKEAGKEEPQVMEVLSTYVGRSEEVPNTFGKTKADYETMTKTLAEVVPKAVDKAIADYEAGV